jgi:hypothetical protein
MDEQADSARVSSQAGPPDPHPLDPLFEQVAAVREFSLNYFAAQKDSAKASVRRLAIKAALGLGGAIIVGTAVVVSTALVIDGLAELVSLAVGRGVWAGKLVVGGGLLLVLGLVIMLYITRIMRVAREHTIRKYESRHHAQRAKFGADVTQRAAE